MHTIKFTKLHGAGNDFILIDDRDGGVGDLTPDVIRRLCDRHTGVGADGVMVLRNDAVCDFAMSYINANGQPGEMCGNGARCAAWEAMRLGMGDGEGVTFRVSGDTYHARRQSDGTVRVRMRAPIRDDRPGRLADLQTAEFPEMAWYDTGVPHLVMASRDPLDGLDIATLGRYWRHHDRFRPAGVNVNVVRRHPDGGLAVRVYERGVEGETLACGTGAVACALFVMERWGAAAPVRVRFPGGDLVVSLDDDGETLSLSGPVVRVFTGQLSPEFADR